MNLQLHKPRPACTDSEAINPSLIVVVKYRHQSFFNCYSLIQTNDHGADHAAPQFARSRREAASQGRCGAGGIRWAWCESSEEMDPTVDACMEVLSGLTANPNHWPENLRSQDLPTYSCTPG